MRPGNFRHHLVSRFRSPLHPAARKGRRRVPFTIARLVGIVALLIGLAIPSRGDSASVSLLGDGLTLPVGAATTVRLSIDNAAGLEGAFFRIGYDGQFASVTAVHAAAVSNSCMIVSNAAPANEVRIALACAVALAGSGTLADITFMGTAAGTTTLNLQECRLNEGSPDCSTSNGAITVSSCVLDVDGSGGLNVATDITYIARHVLGLPPVPASFRTLDPGIPADSVISARIDAASGLDVDGSGDVDIATDAVYIARHTLGLPPVPASFRVQDPTIPSDVDIAAAIDALCP